MKIEDIREAFKKTFSDKSEIIAAYLYGSILNSEFFEDVDIGILINNDYRPETLYEAKLAGELEKLLRNKFNTSKPIDVQVFNKKPLRFLFSVLKNARILYSKDDLQRALFEAKILKEYIDIKPHHELYDKMRRLRYMNLQENKN